MNAIVLAAAMALQPAPGERFDLVCEVAVSQSFHTEHYSVDLVEGRWCRHTGPGSCTGAGVVPVQAMSGGYVVLYDVGPDHRAILLENGSLIASSAGGFHVQPTARCEWAPFTGWSR